ncbi:MAG: hypothetical protein Q8936_05135 [Bacillota bacterium]|nr:hypothetical protein [Bacillota bacterium]
MESQFYSNTACPLMKMNYLKACDEEKKHKSMNCVGMDSCVMKNCPYLKMMNQYGEVYSTQPMMSSMFYPMYAGMMPNIVEGSKIREISMIIPSIAEREDLND